MSIFTEWKEFKKFKKKKEEKKLENKRNRIQENAKAICKLGLKKYIERETELLANLKIPKNIKELEGTKCRMNLVSRGNCRNINTSREILSNFRIPKDSEFYVKEILIINSNSIQIEDYIKGLENKVYDILWSDRELSVDDVLNDLLGMRPINFEYVMNIDFEKSGVLHKGNLLVLYWGYFELNSFIFEKLDKKLYDEVETLTRLEDNISLLKSKYSSLDESLNYGLERIKKYNPNFSN